MEVSAYKIHMDFGQPYPSKLAFPTFTMQTKRGGLVIIKWFQFVLSNNMPNVSTVSVCKLNSKQRRHMNSLTPIYTVFV